jgi:hypothetical protein
MILSIKQNTWKPPDQSSLHNVGRTRNQPKPIAKLVFSSKDIVYRQVSTPKRIGGAERDRTADPLLAKQVLSQLSYSPNHHKHPNGKPSGISIEPSNNQLRSSLPYSALARRRSFGGPSGAQQS